MVGSCQNEYETNKQIAGNAFNLPVIHEDGNDTASFTENNSTVNGFVMRSRWE